MKKMKKIFSSLTLIVLLSPIFSVASIGREARIYLAEANKVPFERWVFVDNEPHYFRATVFFDGPEQPNADIHFQFESLSESVAHFNRQYGTDYRPLPQKSYKLSHHSGVIKKGSVSAEPMEINVHAKTLKPGMTYLLPISMVSQHNGVGVDESKGTLFYLIQAVSPPGAMSNVKIGSLPVSTTDMFLFGTNSLMVRNAEGSLTKYVLQKNGKLSGEQEITGAGALQKMDQIMNFRDHHLIALDRTVNNGILLSFPVLDNMQEIASPDNTFGTAGYTIFSRIIPVGTDLYCLKPSGELMLYPLNDKLEWIGRTQRLGNGWNYKFMFHYKQALIGIDHKGDMWKHPLSVKGFPGIASQIGSGWTDYVSIIALDNDLIALDQQGTLWKLGFGEQGFWAIK